MRLFARFRVRIAATAFAVFLTALPACSQALATAKDYSILHNTDIGGGFMGTFTPVLPTNNASVRQDTTNGMGGLFSVKSHPAPWAGIEFNYGFSQFRESYGSPLNYNVKTWMHEATGAYLFHPYIRRNLQAFVALGGGYVGFIPAAGSSQWRGTGLVEAGLDIPTRNPHLGLRVQGRTLIYRAPDYYIRAVGTVNWVATTEPVAGVWYRW